MGRFRPVVSGEAGYKRTVISNNLDHEMNHGSDCASFVIVASDGLWDVVSEEEACEMVLSILKSKSADSDGGGGGAAADRLVKEGIQRGTQDNVTAVVVFL